jgi:hypothetical protein
MKVNHPQIPTFLFALGLLLLVFSCDKTDEQLPQQNALVLKEEAQVMEAFDETDFFTLSVMQSNGLGMRTSLVIGSDFCADTKVDFFPNNKSIVINFGAGCTSPKGMIRKGKILIFYSALSYDTNTEITTSFDGYEVNGLKIEGRRMLIHRGYNAVGKYFSFQTVLAAGKVTWPNGTFATIEGEHDKKLFLPIDSNGFKLEVTGVAAGRTRLGIPFMTSIEKKLVLTQSCTDKGNWVPSSGIVEMALDTDSKFKVDYGNGDCDKFATVTHNGKTVPVKFD